MSQKMMRVMTVSTRTAELCAPSGRQLESFLPTPQLRRMIPARLEITTASSQPISRIRSAQIRWRTLLSTIIFQMLFRNSSIVSPSFVFFCNVAPIAALQF